MEKEIQITQIEADEIQDRLLLSTIQKIKKLSPIPGKDRVEKVEFENCGYTAIVEKGLHEVGNLVVFTKYDSVVADIPPFDWMREMKFRVKPKSFTIKDEDDNVTGKIYSQGIVIKLDDVKSYIRNCGCWQSFEDILNQYSIDIQEPLEGDDLTELLGTKKYIPPAQNGGSGFGVIRAKGTFPSHLASKTDEMNLASKTKLLEQFKGLHVIGRLKMEGSSITILTDPGTDELNVCSRNNNLQECEGNKFWEAVNRNKLKEKFAACERPDLAKEVVLQAELMGPGIQKNKLGLSEVDIYVFTGSVREKKVRMPDEILENFCEDFDLKMPPKVGEWESFDLTFDELQEIADKLEYLPGVPAEGMVIRPAQPVWCDLLNDWLSVKVINRNYTL